MAESGRFSFTDIYQRHSLTSHSEKRRNFNFTTGLHKLMNNDNHIKLKQHTTREWMKKRGKGKYIDFDGKERAKLKSLFKEMDEDNSGAIGTSELFEPLLALGLMERKDQVESLINRVDTDGSGVIEFEEFLKAIKTAKSDNGKTMLVDIFKDLVSGSSQQDHSDLSFKLYLSNKRRELMMQTYLGSSQNHREKGFRVLQAFSNELSKNPELKSNHEKLMQKKANHLTKLISTRDGLKTSRFRRTSQDSTFLTSLNPQISSKRPTTRQQILFS